MAMIRAGRGDPPFTPIDQYAARAEKLSAILTPKERGLTGGHPSYLDKVAAHLKASDEFKEITKAHGVFMQHLEIAIKVDPDHGILNGILSDYAAVVLQSHGSAGDPPANRRIEVSSALLTALFMSGRANATPAVRIVINSYLSIPQPATSLSSTEAALAALDIEAPMMEEEMKKEDEQGRVPSHLLQLSLAGLCLFKRHAQFMVVSSEQSYLSWPISSTDVAIREAMSEIAPIFDGLDDLVMKMIFPDMFQEGVSPEMAWTRFAMGRGSYAHPVQSNESSASFAEQWKRSVTEYSTMPAATKNLFRTGRPLPTFSTLDWIISGENGPRGSFLVRRQHRHEIVALVAAFPAFDYLKTGFKWARDIAG